METNIAQKHAKRKKRGRKDGHSKALNYCLRGQEECLFMTKATNKEKHACLWFHHDMINSPYRYPEKHRRRPQKIIDVTE